MYILVRHLFNHLLSLRHSFINVRMVIVLYRTKEFKITNALRLVTLQYNALYVIQVSTSCESEVIETIISGTCTGNKI